MSRLFIVTEKRKGPPPLVTCLYFSPLWHFLSRGKRYYSNNGTFFNCLRVHFLICIDEVRTLVVENYFEVLLYNCKEARLLAFFEHFEDV
jgi:hypothetical protein